MALSTRFGVAASFFQTVGTIFYCKIVTGISVFDFFPKIIGLALYMACGFCWFMESLTEETTEKSRWAHIKSRFNQVQLLSLEAPTMVWGFTAGALTLLAGGLALLGLYVAAGPLFWTVSAVTTLAAVCWFKSAQGISTANRTNQAASTFQLISTGLFIASLYFPPIAPLAVLLGVVSAGLWLSSYALDKVFPAPATPEKEVPQKTVDVIPTVDPANSVSTALLFSNRNKNHKNTLIIEEKTAAVIEVASAPPPQLEKKKLEIV